MPRYALIIDGLPVEITGPFTAQHVVLVPNPPIDGEEEPEDGWGETPEVQAVNFPYQWLADSSAEARAEFGILEITPAADPPEGEVLLSAELARVDGQVVEQATFGPPPPPPVPLAVSKMQAKLALFDAGLLDDVDAYMAGAADARTKLYWAEAADIHRDHPLVAGITALLGLTEQQVDDLFRAAAQIQ